MHNQNVNNIRRVIREAAAVDIERVPATLRATTDPMATRKMFELERALAQLPLEQRQVILLVGLEGMSYEDTAGILGLPIGTVRSRLSRGRDALRKAFGYGETAFHDRSAGGGLMGVTLQRWPVDLFHQSSARACAEEGICPGPGFSGPVPASPVSTRSQWRR